MGKSKTYELLLKIGGRADSSLRSACEEADKNLSQLGESAKAVGKAAATGIAAASAAVVAGGKYLYDLGTEFDGAYDAIRIGTGATGDALADLQKSMKNVYAAVPAEMELSAKAIADYNTRLGVTGPVLETISKQAIQASDMLGDDLNTVITNSSQAFQQWGVSEGRMADGMDHIFKVSQSTGMGFSTLMGDLQKYGAQLQEMGYGFEESSVLIGQMEKAGVNVPEVLGAMKKSVTAMAKEGFSATTGMSKYCDAIKSAGSATEAINIAAEVFGTRAASTMSAAIRDGTLDVDGLTAALSASTETISTAANDTYDLAEKWEMFRHRLDIAMEPAATTVFNTIGAAIEDVLPMVEAFIPVLADGVARAVEKLIDAAKWIGKNKDMIMALAAGIGTVTLAYKVAQGALTVYNAVMSVYEVVCAASAARTFTLAGAMAALNWPVILVTAAILAIVAAGVLLYKNWDTVKAKAIELWAKVSPVFSGIKDAAMRMVAAISPKISVLVENFKNFGATAIRIATQFKEKFGPIITLATDTISNTVIPKLVAAFQFIAPKVQALLSAITTTVGSVLGWLISNISSFVQTITGAISGIWSVMSPVIDAIVAGIQLAWPFIEKIIGDSISNISATIGTVMDIFRGVIDFIGNVFAGDWAGAWDNIVGIFGNVFGLIVNLAKAPINAVISAINWVLGKINSLSITIPDWVPGLGGQTFGFSIPEIPQLAVGGIAMGPTIAEIGEGGEPEAVLPLSKLANLLDRQSKPPKERGNTDPQSGSVGDGGRQHLGGSEENVTFAPVFNFYGPTTKEEAHEAGRASFTEFKRLYKQMKAEERRKVLVHT